METFNHVLKTKQQYQVLSIQINLVVELNARFAQIKQRRKQNKGMKIKLFLQSLWSIAGLHRNRPLEMK